MHSQSISSLRLDTFRVLQRSAFQWLTSPKNLAYATRNFDYLHVRSAPVEGFPSVVVPGVQSMQEGISIYLPANANKHARVASV